MTKEKTTVVVFPKVKCSAQAPIKQMKIEEKDNANVIVYGRDMDAVCPHCNKQFKDHK